MTWVALYLLFAVVVFVWLRNDRSADGTVDAIVVIALCWPIALALILLMIAVSLLIALWRHVGCR